jgi:glycosyltransferase involved in cell wall biosynthesis
VKPDLVSVIIPVFNGEHYLAEAIQSARAQTYSPIEIIVVDDGSTDGTAAVVRQLGPEIRYDRIEHAGAGAARNRGALIATGNFCAFLDADDLWVAGKTALQMRYLGEHPEVDIVFGRAEQFHSPELTPDQKARLEGAGSVIAAYCPGTLLMRSEAFERAGFITTEFRVGEFIDWYLKATDNGLRGEMLQEIVLRRRLHTTNTGITQKNARGDYVRIVKAALDRRRKGIQPT